MSLCYEMLQAASHLPVNPSGSSSAPLPVRGEGSVNPEDCSDSITSPASFLRKEGATKSGPLLGKEWVKVYSDLLAEIKVRHYSPKTLTFVPDEGEYRRYHLHETHVNKAIRRAVRKAKILNTRERSMA